MMHLPDTALYSRVYIYIPIGLYFMDRLIRTSRYAWNNVRPGRATLTALEGGVTKVCIRSKTIHKWSPGSHVFLSIPKFGIGQSHPATIASIPTSHDGELVFILKGHKGFTSRLHKSATNSSAPLFPTREDQSRSSSTVQDTYVALMDGPYGSSHNDFGGFDTVFLISGSTGITFTLPILLNLASRAQRIRLPVKRVVFLWIVKNTSWTSWISNELTTAANTLREAGIELSMRIHVTCDEDFTTGDESDSKECGCECDKSLGPCCCVNIEEDPTRLRQAETASSEKVEKKDPQIVIQRSTSSSSTNTGVKSQILPCAIFYSGRPDFYKLLWELLEQAEGETGVAVCGPLGLNSDVRKVVSKCSDERAVHKGTGAQGIYLHAECFGW
jgi:ferric-chelate reductase